MTTGSAFLARTAALLVAAATLLVAPVGTGSSYAVLAPCAALACAADGDADGDGLPDSVDGCPTVASGNPTGCPSAARRASLSWSTSDRRLQARITSPEPSCSARARIVLWRVRPTQDVKVAAASAAYSGRRRFTVSRGASYYVTVSPSYVTGVAECGRATSRTVRVPRR